jgi:hypothetical protein
VDRGTTPHVQVDVEKQRIRITDNGRGMRVEDLRRFFTMHGENEDRKQGKAGRGYFGTGKSAAFAIADELRITTVREGRRSVVELSRRDLEAARSGAPVPIREIEIETPCGEPNGTSVEITKLKPIKLDRLEISRTLEKHIRHWRGVTVELDGRKIEPSTPPISQTQEIVGGEEDPLLLRGLELSLHVSKAPLTDEDRGVAILSSGVLHEITLAGAERKEFSQYIFGELDVPALSEPFEGVAAFDMSRSGQLNPQNKLVLEVYAFVGRHIEVLRKQLVEADRARKRDAEAARLQAQAAEIAKLINEDYAEFRRRFKPVRSSGGGTSDTGTSEVRAAEGEVAFVAGGEQPAQELGQEGAGDEHRGAGGIGGGDSDGDTGPAIEPAEPESATTEGGASPVKPARERRAGGFDVKYRNNGEENPRAQYETESRTIYINLDHPQLLAARGVGEVDQPNFRRMSLEVAFTEYAIGFAQENVRGGFYQDLFEPLTDMRDRIDSIARRASYLFRDDS